MHTSSETLLSQSPRNRNPDGVLALRWAMQLHLTSRGFPRPLTAAAPRPVLFP
jgi:hypothetical protein